MRLILNEKYVKSILTGNIILYFMLLTSFIALNNESVRSESTNKFTALVILPLLLFSLIISILSIQVSIKRFKISKYYKFILFINLLIISFYIFLLLKVL